MVAINCDMGEAFSIYRCGDDEGLMPWITLANVACGFHASDPRVMRRTVALAKEHGVRVGAHPSLPDREGFGRREMKMERDELTAAVIYQVGALSGFLREQGMELNHIKPHGSLYGMAARDEQVAEAVADAADVFGVPLMGMSGTVHERVWGASPGGFISEYYADLDYRPDGSLIITREHAAFDPASSARKARAGRHRRGRHRRRRHRDPGARRLRLRALRHPQRRRPRRRPFTRRCVRHLN